MKRITRDDTEHGVEYVRADEAEAEILEQCRINGMSAEREEALRAEVERLKKAVADEREAIIQEIPGGYSVDPQWVCDMIRARGNT